MATDPRTLADDRPRPGGPLARGHGSRRSRGTADEAATDAPLKCTKLFDGSSRIDPARATAGRAGREALEREPAAHTGTTTGMTGSQ
ncbi:MAG: hypothetical protein KA265_10665 [Piscinibacter sp.]|nr:hypothetical protein [Piscinibacter sp.]